MKTFSLAFILVSSVLFNFKLQAQDTTGVSSNTARPFAPISSFRTWSVGAYAGALSPVVFFGKNDFTNWEVDFGYGLYLKKQILPAFGLKADVFLGRLRGDNSETLGNGTAPGRPYSAFETDLKWAASLSGNLTLANINWLHKRSLIQPYVTAGAGLMSYHTTLTTTSGTSIDYTPNKNIRELYIPVGAGLKFNVSPSLAFDIGYTMNFVDGDNLDGVHFGPQNDKFSFTRVGLELALGSRSKPQLAAHNPVASMQYDYMAQNQALRDELSTERANGARQLSQFREEWAKVLADADKDGVSDYFDKCPGTPADVKVDGAGCPLPQAKNVTNVITEEDRRVVREAIRNLEFDFGKATIRPRSFPTLNRVANLLKEKNFSLKLAGHTDNVGSAEANLRLSKARAEAIKAYLVGQGANASRIEATGYGENQPIASNKTNAGRQKNRRVEFTLY